MSVLWPDVKVEALNEVVGADAPEGVLGPADSVMVAPNPLPGVTVSTVVPLPEALIVIELTDALNWNVGETADTVTAM